MSWLKIDDGFPEHEKVFGLAGPGAKWLHVVALCQCAKNLTDGVLDAQRVKVVCAIANVPRPAHAIAQLVAAGLWLELGCGAYEIKDYLDYNPDAATVKAERDKARDRMRKLRGSGERSGEQTGERSGERANERAPRVRQPRPVPSPNSTSNEVDEPAAPGQALVPLAGGDARTLVAAFVDEARQAGLEPPRRTVGHLAAEVGRLLKEGQTPEAVAAGLARMVQRGLVIPSALPNFVMEAQLPSRPVSGQAQRYGRGVSTETILDMAARAAAEEREAS